MGSWRAHFPYHQVQNIVVNGSVFYASSFSGIMSYDREDGIIERYNRVNGLSEVGITTFDCHYETKSLLIGYRNGVIDIMKNGKISKIDEIYRADILGNKSVKGFKSSGDSVFIVLPFGISVMNIHTHKVLATYIFGNSNISLVVNDVAVLSDSLFVATNKGIYTAPRKGLNLLNFNNWKKLTNIPYENEEYNFCEGWADTVWLGKKIPTIWRGDSVFMYRKGEYRPFNLTYGGIIRLIKKKDNYLYISTYPRIYVFNENGQLIYNTIYYPLRGYSGASDVYMFYRNDMVIGDYDLGLIFRTRNNPEDTLKINGPEYYRSWHINVSGDEVWVSGGSPNSMWSDYGMYRFKGSDNEWINFNRYTTDSLIAVRNISLSVTNPKNPKQTVAGSHGYGIVEFMDTSIIRTYNSKNSMLDNVIGVSSIDTRVTGLAFDNNQNLWILQWGTKNSLAVKKRDGEWDSFDFYGDNVISIGNRLTGEMVATKWGDIWAVLPGRGMLVFNPAKMLNREDNAFKIFSIIKSDGKQINDIQAIAVDNDETVWLGIKSGGILVYYNPRAALTSNMVASQLFVQVDDRIEYLFGAEEVTCIKVDGGNRKWIATNGGGAYLISEGGNKEILNLNSKNSQLISDIIYSIGINEVTGEVFFATNLGLVSYVGSATKGVEQMEKLDIYPNPVHKDYYGNVIIRGLMKKTTIKITDLSGKLIYETYSNGGTGIWNVRDFDGNTVPTGVYYVLCASEDGLSVTTGKILVTGK